MNQSKILQFAKKWTQATRAHRRNKMVKSQIASKGHTVVYTTDEKRFVVPISFLSSNTFTELFCMAEEVFGLLVDGRITLPCDAEFLQYVISCLKRRASKEVEKELLKFISTSRCSQSSISKMSYQHQILC
ncbi:SAUR-like auxin-responsive protein family [Zostera marina]|uniref:SAUR-like auxin-responsive protein family n=1 Tax=Zostera marina TaxID=29655 RepID=A0A0K9P1A9_ZOSMR|nr:SAUR-like auxin-responsive protein family [Zostera marina]